MELTNNQIKTLEAANRILEKMATYSHDVKFTSADMAKRYFATKLSHLGSEQFHVAFLNSQHGLISAEVISLGTINQAPVFPREVAKRALELDAHGIILAHNHPSGEETPSRADINITQVITDAMNLLDVTVLDHIIVARGKTMSFAERGLL